MTREEYKQLLEPHLPPPILERAVRNFDKRRCSMCVADGRGLAPSMLIDYGFAWRDTSEGFSFWMDVHDPLAYGRPDELPSVKGLPT